jgi:hypothetical protein
MVQRTGACSRDQNRREFIGGDDMTRVFLAGIFHETHSFTGTVTGLDGFVIHRGEEILRRRGDASQVDGFLSVAEREGWEVVPAPSIPAVLPAPWIMPCSKLSGVR